MTPAEKIILKKALSSLRGGMLWSGGSTDWPGYANQMKGTIKSATQLLDTILELPENNEKPPLPDRNLIDDLLP